MRKFLITYCLLLLVSLSAASQNARKVLDATAACMTQSGDVKVKFKATQFSGTTPQGDATGTLLISGNKFQMTTEEISTWYDGKTQWSMMKGSNEVNISEPDEEEQAAMNPAKLVSIYKSGYKYSIKESSLRGKATFVVTLQAKNSKAAFDYIILDVDKATYQPLCIRARKDGDWMRLSILAFENKLNFPDNTFQFPIKDYPDIEQIDLR